MTPRLFTIPLEFLSTTHHSPPSVSLFHRVRKINNFQRFLRGSMLSWPPFTPLFEHFYRFLSTHTREEASGHFSRINNDSSKSIVNFALPIRPTPCMYVTKYILPFGAQKKRRIPVHVERSFCILGICFCLVDRYVDVFPRRVTRSSSEN